MTLRRREFVVGGSAAAVWPMLAHAQQPARPVIGFLGSGTFDGFKDRVDAFRQGLRESGYIDDRDVAIEYRWAQGRYDRLAPFAVDFVRSRVAMIVTCANVPAALAAKAATTTIPILFATGADPVKFGVVQSLGRPGGNLTGVSTLGIELEPKQFELVSELSPDITAVGLLLNPANPNSVVYESDAQTAADSTGKKLIVVKASTEGEFTEAFAALVREQAGALVVISDTLFNIHPKRLVELAALNRIPAIYPFPDYAKVGGLISYGPNIGDAYRQLGVYAGRVLNGEKPSDLPVVQSAKFSLILNLKTANELALDVPTSILLRADEVIE